MTDREAFIEAIAATPEEDTPRLAFADWLDEHGESARAEFIRLQCRMTWLWSSYTDSATRLTDPAYQELHDRARDLLKVHRDVWLGELIGLLGVVPAPAGKEGRRTWLDRVLRRPPRAVGSMWWEDSFPGCYATYEVRGDAAVTGFNLVRGFINSINLWLGRPSPPRSLPRVFRMEPVTRMAIDIDGRLSDWQAIDGPHLARLADLVLGLPGETQRQRVSLVDSILAGSNWAGVRSLGVFSWDSERGWIPPAFAASLARSPLASSLSSLKVRTDLDGLTRLATSPHLSGLRDFEAWGCDLPSEAGRVLAGAVFSDRLERLGLGLNELDDEGAWNLIWQRRWPRLRSLDLDANRLGDAGAQAIALIAGQLEELSLCSNEIGDAGALALAEAVDPTRLQALWLSYNPLSPQVVGRIRERLGEKFQFVPDEKRAVQ